MTEAITIDVLRAAQERLFEHRKMLRKAQVALRFWPDGLAFSCRVSLPFEDEVPSEVKSAALAAQAVEVVPWAELPSLSAERAREIADRVCAPAHKYLGAAGSA